MAGARRETCARASQSPPPDGRGASARANAPGKAVNGSPGGTPRPEETRNGARRGQAKRGASEGPEVPFHDLLRGLRAGDLETVLLTVAMAAEENRMPSADPDEERRILAFLARLAEHDTGLPPPPDGRTDRPLDGIDAGDGAPGR